MDKHVEAVAGALKARRIERLKALVNDPDRALSDALNDEDDMMFGDAQAAIAALDAARAGDAEELVERLKGRVRGPYSVVPDDDCHEAADRILALEAAFPEPAVSPDPSADEALVERLAKWKCDYDSGVKPGGSPCRIENDQCRLGCPADVHFHFARALLAYLGRKP